MVLPALVPSSTQLEQAMALWLCRLESDGLAAVGRDDSRARQLGIGAWVLPIQLAADRDARWQVIQRCFAIPSGLPLLLEWVIDRSCSLEEERALAAQLLLWLDSHRALPLEQRPALLLQGTHQLDAAEQTAQRLRRSLASGLGRIPLLLCGAGEPAAGFDGCCDWIAPLRTDSPADKGNYEVYLQKAHWRPPPNGRSIPAVRALTADDHAGMSGFNPELYSSWLGLVSNWSSLLANGDPQAPVLIDSWTGHQESCSAGAMEPLPLPVAGLSDQPRLIQWGEPCADRLALMVHGFYLDGLAAILERLPEALLSEIDIYVSTPLERLAAAAAVLRRRGCPVVKLFGVTNRGRDIAPFLLQLLPAVLANGHRGFIKLHTKASPHLADGEDWGEHLIASLLDPSLLQGLGKQLQMDHGLGLLAPAGTRVPITLQLQNNGPHLLQLQRRSGMGGVELLGAEFIAGSMFAGRVDLLKPLVNLGQQLSDFEPEAGQTDGTLAHALERWIGVLAHYQRFRVDELPGNSRAMPGFGYRWSTHLGSPYPSVRMGTSQTQPLQGFPLIDSPLFKAHQREGLFGEHASIAEQLHQRGYAVIDLGRDRMESISTAIRSDLRSYFDPEVEAWRARGAQYSPRLQDAWQQSNSVRELALLPDISEVLSACWGREPFAFQTLNFPVGTQQELHSDAVHFHSEPAGFMCGVWVPLEDIHPDSGPLLYVPGTHRFPYLQAADVGVVQRKDYTPTQEIFEPYWKSLVASGEYQVESFTPQVGQALIWSANLIHGGSPVADPLKSRWSQVTHYFFEGCRHYTPMLSDWPNGPVAWRNPFDIAQGKERKATVLEKGKQSSEMIAIKELAQSYAWTLQRLVPGLFNREAMEQALLEEAIASREGGAAPFSLALMEWALEAGYTSPWLQDNRARALIDLQRPQEACQLWQELAEPHHSPELRSVAAEMLSLHGDSHQWHCPQLEEVLLQMDLESIQSLLEPALQQNNFESTSTRQSLSAWVDRQGCLSLLLPFLEARMVFAPAEGLRQLIDDLRPLRTSAQIDYLLRVSQELILAFGWRADAQSVQLLAKTNTGRWLMADSTGPALGRPDVAEHLQLSVLPDAGFMATLSLEPGESLKELWLQGHSQHLEIRDLRGLPYLGVVDQLLQLCQPGFTPLERAPALFESGLGKALHQLARPLQRQEHWASLIDSRVHFGIVAHEADITVVIPLYRRWDFILGHIAAFSQDPWFIEQRVRLLYVIDDPAIQSPLLEWSYGNLVDEQLDITFLTLNKNCGFALACNCGVQAAETEKVFLMNSDVLPLSANWLPPLITSLENDPNAVIAPVLLTDEGCIQHAGMTFDFESPGSLPRCVHPFKGLDPSYLNKFSINMAPYSVDALSGAALMFRREIFLDYGGFDPVFGRGDYEDLEFSVRCKNIYSSQLLIAPESRLLHLERQSFESSRQVLDEWRQTLNAWLFKNPTQSIGS